MLENHMVCGNEDHFSGVCVECGADWDDCVCNGAKDREALNWPSCACGEYKLNPEEEECWVCWKEKELTCE